MTPNELSVFASGIDARYAELGLLIDKVATASSDSQSSDYSADTLAEGVFLRAFSAYEADLERLFIHYVSGGLTLLGVAGTSYLNVTDEMHARKLTKGVYKFLSWAKPSAIRETATTYLENGWPFVAMMSTKEQLLADCERVRNRIAHASIESKAQFEVVQRNMLGTARLYDLSGGQFLRIRQRQSPKLHLGMFVDVMHETVGHLINPIP